LTADSRCVAVLAPNWLGDAVMALPAIADVRRHFGSARLVVAARASVAALFGLVPGVDGVVTLRWRGRLSDRSGIEADIASLQTSCGSMPGVALLLPNSFATAWLTRRANMIERWGYATDWRQRLLTRSVHAPKVSMHQGHYYQHLVRELGIPSGPLEPVVDVTETDRSRAAQLLSAAGWDGEEPLVTMAPGAAYGTAKRWLPRHFAQLISTLMQTRGVRTALVGSAADAETVRLIEAHGVTAARPIDLTGKTSLRELAGVLAVSSACVSNDSGAMHLAGAIGTPLVALFGPTRETETAPLTRAGGRRDVVLNPVWCRPCMLRECPIDHRCMKGLAPERVAEALSRVMSRPASEADGIDA
jgi:heptosyltransferase-2